MDENHLKDLLGGETPTPDENARKRAVNLALAEFEAAKKESRKTFQGFSLWSRLTGRTNENPRRDRMNRKLVYGGMATAMVVVLASGVTLMQVNAPAPVAVSGEAGFSSIAANMTQSANPVERWRKIQGGQPQQAPGGEVSESYKKALQEMGNAPQPALGAYSALPVPLGQARGPIMTDAVMPPSHYQDQGRDQFADFEENAIKSVIADPVSTFSIDVDTASYAFIRRQLNAGVLPQKDAIRVEEMINYFDYDYARPDDKAQPFKPNVTVLPSPWAEGHKLVHIAIQGYDIEPEQRPRSNLVFLLDTSGSMNAPDKLPLLKNSLKMLLETLGPDDSIAIVTYAGSAGTVLEPTKVKNKAKILAALENLNAGGSTAGAEGIRQAYQLAKAGFDKAAVNRVLLATDGDFNVGITNPEELKDFVERERGNGIFLSVLGFGQGNLNDRLMQQLAQNGNGVAAYIDTLNEARKVLVEESASTLFTIAKDVKIQVEFNPETVAEYRLVGYETRALKREDFNNDAVDAGDIGAGHSVTAIYDITPAGVKGSLDDSRYARAEEHKAETQFGGEYGFLKIRYKLPDEDQSKLITAPIPVGNGTALSDDVRFGVAVAGFGQLLKGGKYTGALTYDAVIEQAQAAKGGDEFGYRAEFIQLVRLAKSAAALPAQP